MRLYKYFPMARRSVFRDRLVRFTPPVEFNDPFESNPAFLPSADVPSSDVEEKLVQGMIAHLSISSQEARKSLHGIWELLHGKLAAGLQDTNPLRLSKAYGVLSLTERRDSLLMWSHYAQSHTGFVLGFDEQHAFFERFRRAPKGNARIAPVQYKRKRPAKAYEQHSGIDFFFTKSIEWAYEKEWRIVCPLTEATIVHTAETGGHPLHLFELPQSAIVEVGLGARVPDAAVECIQFMIQHLAGGDLKHVEIYKARLHRSDFALTFERVPDIPENRVREIWSEAGGTNAAQ